MFVFGVDVPVVELMFFFLVISIILVIEILVVIILKLYKMKENKRMMRSSLEVAKILLELKDRELRLKKIKR